MKERGLTIQEAIKSGRPFRRKGFISDWIYTNGKDLHWCSGGFHFRPNTEDVLTSDWELKPEKLEPVSWETEILRADSKHGYIHSESCLAPFVGRKVRVTVEAIEGGE